MTTVRAREGEASDSVIRRFKRLAEKAGTIRKARSQAFYEKPTKKRKRKHAAAIKRYQKKLMRDVQGSRGRDRDRRK